MERRDFFKILSATSAGALAGCGRQSDKLIPLLVADREIVPGEEQWRPAACTECGAGCGTLVRVMAGVRTIERSGEKLAEPIACIKKIEGNPLDPVSGGHLCALGQSAVQGLYHPDRLHGPMKRAGDRGKAQFAGIPWAEAIGSAAEKIGKARAADPSKILFLTGPQVGSRSLAIQRFAQAVGAPAPVICSVADFAVERKAAEMVFGWNGLPVYDIGNAHYVLGVGADFLGGWASPVYYGRQFGHFRQGRLEVRGRLVQAESRLSITAAAADQWLPLRPGTESRFLAAVGRIVLDAGLARNREPLPKTVADGFQTVDVAAVLASCGLEEKRVRDAVERLGESQAPLILAGASIPHADSLDAIIASHYLNLMLGNVGQAGGVLPPGSQGSAPAAGARAAGGGASGSANVSLERRSAAAALAQARVVLIDGANPAYTLPRSSGVLDALARAETVISFGNFLDDSGAWSDLLLPDHHALESEIALVPAVSPQTGVTVATPFVQPLYDTRAVEKTLADLAHAMNVPYQAVTAKDIVQPLLSGDTTYDDAVRQGGIWVEKKGAEAKSAEAKRGEAKRPAGRPSAPALASNPPAPAPNSQAPADTSQYPFEFQPYPSLQYGDGSGSHLPWMQELPDPSSSSIWGLPVEVDPKTAARLRIANGDIVRVESPHGSLEAPAYVHPGAVPNVVSMAIGDGHTHYTRYASGRGANPLSILAPAFENSTGALVLGGTRVRLARVGGPRGWTQFSFQDREERGSSER